MSDSLATLSVDIFANDKVSDVLTKLDAQLDRTNSAAQRAGAGIGKGIGSGAAQASDSTLTLAQAQARLLSTTGQNQAAFNTLSGAINSNSGNALQNIRAKTQLAQIENKLSGQSQSLTSLFQGQASAIAGLGGQLGALGGQAGALSSSFGALAGSFGGLGAAGAAIGIAKVGLDLATAGANADLVRTRFDSLAAAANTTGEALLGALRKASGGEISDLNLELAANRANLLGVAKSADEMGVLMAIAKDRAQQLGTSSAKAFDDLITGLGRGSPLILDNLGIMVSVGEANDAYAASLGKTTSALSEAEKKQALINAVLAQGKASLEATGGAAESNAGKLAAAQASIENFKNAVGSLLALQVGPYAAEYSKLVNALAGTGSAIEGIGSLANLGSKFNPSVQVVTNLTSAVDSAGAAVGRFAGIQIPDNFSPLRDSVAAWLQLLGLTPPAAQAAAQATIAASTSAAGAADTMESARAREAAATNMAADSAAAYRAIEIQAAANAVASANAQMAYASSLEMAGVQARAAAEATQIKANADQVASVDAQTHALAQQQLAAQAQAAAQALLAGGQAGANTAALLAGSSSQVDVLTAAYYRLAAAQAAANASKVNAAALASQRSGERNPGTSGVAEAAAQEQARLNAIYKKLVVPPIKEPKGAKGGGGGGGTKLSDQQKLNNSLLSSQEAYQSKAESAEQTHLDKLASINADFQAKMKKAQESFAQSQLEGRAGFYDSLGSIEDQGLRTALAAEYEAAFAEADKIATEKGADVGQKFLEAKQAAIQAQGQRASEIADATKSGDKDKAAYLAGVDKLYREAENRKLEAIKAGTDSAASERDAAIAAEGESYTAAQEKIGTAADQAAARKVLAAERAGQAVDAEGAKVDALTAKYDTLGVAGARAGVSPATTAAATTTTDPTAAVAAPTTKADDVAVAIGSLRSALAAIESAVKSSGDKITGAVKSIPRSVT